MQAKEYETITENLISLFPLFRRFLRVSEGENQEKHNNMLNPQYPILGILSHSGLLPMSEIGMLIGVSKPNMSVLIDHLIAEKKVKREYDDDDRRIIRIRITEKGKETLKIAKEVLALNEKDITMLSDSLTKMRDVLSKIDKQNRQNKQKPIKEEKQ
ncbi:MAG: MarR family transcriptional regulator [Candidatus Woesearchaeota archaeon]|nr:MarR family transcriptional regulator [Candidatus Woesearchaeota archaeon]